MVTLTYSIPYDIHTYVITCPNNLLKLYVDLLIENGAYEIYVDNEVYYDGK